MRLRSVFTMQISILNTATTEQMGYIIFSFFCLLQIHSWVRMGILQKNMDFHGIKSQKADIPIVVYIWNLVISDVE